MRLRLSGKRWLPEGLRSEATARRSVRLGWCPPDTSIAPPRIFGDVTRDNERCNGIMVGVSAQQAAPAANAWHVLPDAAAITIERLRGELLYALDKPSLVLRAAAQAGTGREWALLSAQ
jgi:hypothetical protein